MVNPPTGGPAFPPTHDPRNHPSGMTLRQWYAGQALAGMNTRFFEDDVESADQIADQAFLLADAMLRRSAK